MDRKLAGVDVENVVVILDVTSDCDCCNGFQHFLYFPIIYFSISNSSIVAQIGLIVLQTCLCNNKVFDVNISRLLFY